MSTASETLAVSIQRPPDDVYAFVLTATNMPRWAPAFCRAIRPAGEGWVIVTPDGEFGLRFVPRNEFRVLDHYVTLASGQTAYVPMRVLATADGHSEVIFTLFRQPGMTDADFAQDRGMVERDLTTLKQVLENG